MRGQTLRDEEVGDYWGELGGFLRFGLPMIPASFIWGLIMGVDRLMLERLADLSEVGIYNVADMLALFLLNYTRPINGVLQSRFSVLLSQRPEDTRIYVGKAVKYMALLLFPGAVGLSMASRPLVDFISGPQFHHAATMLPVLALAYVLIGLSNPLYQLVFLQRGGKAFLYLYTICLGINVLLNIYLIPGYGGRGAAGATLVSIVAYVAGLVLLSDRKAIGAIEAQALAYALGCSVFMGMVLYAAQRLHPVFDSLLLIPLGVIVYGLSIHLVGLISLSERKLLLSPLYRLGFLLRAPFQSSR